MNLWIYSLREMLRRPARSILTLLGISLGLATLVATQLTSETVRNAYSDLANGIAGRRTLLVTAPAEAGFDAHVAEPLRALPGVADVQTNARGVVALFTKRGRLATPLLGIHEDSNSWRICDGRFPQGDGEALLEAGLAKAMKLAVGDSLQLWAPTGPYELQLTGLVRSSSTTPSIGGFVLLPLARAQQILGLKSTVNSIQISLRDDADPATVQICVAQHLPSGLDVQPPDKNGEMARATLHTAEQGLGALSLMALIIATFLMANTVLLSLSERRHDFAILRSLGTTRWQLMRLLLRESLAFGCAGSIIGILFGLALAFGMCTAMTALLAIPVPELKLSPGPFILAGLLGPMTALLAAMIPCWLASCRPPLFELVGIAASGSDQHRHSLSWIGGFLLLTGIGLAVATRLETFSFSASRHLLPLVVGLILVGGVLFAARITEMLLNLISRFPLGLPTKLATQQLQRHPGRTRLATGILMLALATSIGFGHAVRATVQDLQSWFKKAIPADYLIRSSMPDASLSLLTAMPESLITELRQSQPNLVIDHISFVPAQVDGISALVLARSFTPGQALPLALRSGEPGQVEQSLRQGGAVLGVGLAQQLRSQSKKTITLSTPRGPVELPVAGVATEYTGGGSTIYLEWDTARRLLDLQGTHALLVSVPASVNAVDIAATLQRFCENHGLLLQSNADFLGDVVLMVSRVTASLWVFMALLFVIAAMGVVNTITINIHEQKQEFGILRALGMLRSSIRNIILIEAILLAIVSLLPGVVIGSVLGYLIIQGGACWGGPAGSFALDLRFSLGASLLSILIALLAALVPGRRVNLLPVIKLLN